VVPRIGTAWIGGHTPIRNSDGLWGGEVHRLDDQVGEASSGGEALGGAAVPISTRPPACGQSQSNPLTLRKSRGSIVGVK